MELAIRGYPMGMRGRPKEQLLSVVVPVTVGTWHQALIKRSGKNLATVHETT